MKKGGLKIWLQITNFAISFTVNITNFGNIETTVKYGKNLYPVYNNNKRLYDSW